MKPLGIAVILCAAWGLILYLAGSFVAASFDIETWDGVGRAFIAFFWFVGCILGAGVADWFGRSRR